MAPHGATFAMYEARVVAVSTSSYSMASKKVDAVWIAPEC